MLFHVLGMIVVLDIRADGSVTGKVDNATCTMGRLKRNCS